MLPIAAQFAASTSAWRFLGALSALNQQLTDIWGSILRAVPKQRRSKKVLLWRQKVQNAEFSQKHLDTKFTQCGACGNWKKHDNMCLFCFKALRDMRPKEQIL